MLSHYWSLNLIVVPLLKITDMDWRYLQQKFAQTIKSFQNTTIYGKIEENY